MERMYSQLQCLGNQANNCRIPRRPEKPRPFPDNIVNLGDWERVQYNKCPDCLELLVDVAANTMDNAQV